MKRWEAVMNLLTWQYHWMWSILRMSGPGWLLAIQVDPLMLSNFDNPGSSLTSVLFNGTNFLGLNRRIRISLGAKMKLGFIDGTLTRFEVSLADYLRWNRCDSMVMSWMLNSMIPDLSLCNSVCKILKGALARAQWNIRPQQCASFFSITARYWSR